MKVYDCFMFSGEKDILDIRLNTVAQYVSDFVISESALDHRMNPKPLYLKEMLETDHPIVKPFKNRIRRIEVDLSRCKKDTWEAENLNREALRSGLDDADPDDIVLLSDADEIPDPKYIKFQIDQSVPIMVYRMPFFYYNFRWIKKFECHGTTGIKFSRLHERSLNDYRNSRFHDPYVSMAGWHCSWFGTAEEILAKIKRLAHAEFDVPSNWDVATIQDRVDKGHDVYGRGQSENLVPRPSSIHIPEYVDLNRKRFALYV